MASRKNKPSRPPARNRGYEFIASACLAGINCTHSAQNNLKPAIRRMVREGLAITVCPEVMGGMEIPRETSEIIGGEGKDVLSGSARVFTASGKDVTKKFLIGSERALGMAKKFHIKKALLKSNSPACGAGHIYDGTFTGNLKKGDGVFAALLVISGIKIHAER